MHAQAAVLAGAGQTDEYAELRRCPLRGRRVTIAADVVARFFLKSSELLRKENKALVGARKEDDSTNFGSRFGVDLPHGFGRHRGR
jgi:hypothetical protein